MTLIKSRAYDASAPKKHLNVFNLALMLFLLPPLFLSCGKKVDEEKPDMDSYEEPQVSELDRLLNKQELFCGSDKNCPEWITKIAIVEKNSLRFCTGFLHESGKIVTSASCLPGDLRQNGASCEKSIYFYFANPGSRPHRFNCDQIEYASELQGKNPLFWKNDIAYLTVKESVERKVVSFPKARVGLTHMDRFYTWTMDQIDDHQGIIRRTDGCQSIHESFFNPLANKDSSPVMTFAGCSFSSGNMGSPILDYRGKVRGIISRPVDAGELEEIAAMRILERPLRSLVHASNFACLSMLDGSEVLDSVECNKELTLEKHDQLQNMLMNEDRLFEKFLSKLEHQANEKNRYIKFRMLLDTESNGFYSVRYAPRCFKDVSQWIGEFNNNKAFTFYLETPRLRIRKAMSEFGRIFTQEISNGEVSMSVQFRPKILKGNNPRRANVYTRSKYDAFTYESVTEDCSQLLLF